LGSIFILPQEVMQKVIAMCGRFLWSIKRSSLIAWDNIYLRKNLEEWVLRISNTGMKCGKLSLYGQWPPRKILFG